MVPVVGNGRVENIPPSPPAAAVTLLLPSANVSTELLGMSRFIVAYILEGVLPVAFALVIPVGVKSLLLELVSLPRDPELEKSRENELPPALLARRATFASLLGITCDPFVPNVCVPKKSEIARLPL